MTHPGKLTLIFPLAADDAESEFRGFAMAGQETLVHRSLRAFLPYTDRIEKVCYIVLDAHARRFDIEARLVAETHGLPYEIVRLSSATSGPAETVARAVAKAKMAGPAIVCDIDHRIDPTPFFARIDEDRATAALAGLWPLCGQDLKRWSVACISPDGQIESVSERRLPEGAGLFFGVVGCYYFAAIEAVMDLCLERRFKRFSDYFNHLSTCGVPARGVQLENAEFFGDAEQIRLLEEGRPEFRGTIFCDIDGTLIVHEDKPDYSRLPQVLPGSREKLRRWIAEGYAVVLCTARRREDEPMLAEMLRELDIPYHHIVTGLPSGLRILINDRKPYAMFTTQAASLEIMRDQGISDLEILPGRKPDILRRFEGGSFAETLLVEEGGKVFVRKRAPKDSNVSLGYRRLRDQFRTLERFAQLSADLVPALYNEENNSHEYFYDMEFLRDHRPLADCTGEARAAALDNLFDRFGSHLYSQRSTNDGAAEDWFQRYTSMKIAPKLDTLSGHECLRPLLRGDGATIDGTFRPSLERLLERMRGDKALAKLKPRFLSLVHGDLTFQNIMTRDGGGTRVIDMEAGDSLEAIELDLGKLYQSTHSQYETWSKSRAPLCNGPSPSEITLKFKPSMPDTGIVSAICGRWSDILDVSEDEVEARAGLHLGFHLVRMVPFRMKTSMDQALYALATALVWLDNSLDKLVF